MAGELHSVRAQIIIIGAILFAMAAVSRAGLNYWAAPVAAGTGDGSSQANAANYLNSTFWSAVQVEIAVIDVTVNFLDGNYNAGTLNLNDMGNPLHRLLLQAQNRYGAAFSTTGNTIVGITGWQNIEFYGILFTGPCSSWGIDCQPNHLKSSRSLGS